MFFLHSFVQLQNLLWPEYSRYFMIQNSFIYYIILFILIHNNGICIIITYMGCVDNRFFLRMHDINNISCNKYIYVYIVHYSLYNIRYKYTLYSVHKCFIAICTKHKRYVTILHTLVCLRKELHILGWNVPGAKISVIYAIL